MEVKMAELKTKKTEQSVEDFLNTIPDVQTRQDCFAIVKLMQKAAQAKPKMWGPSIVGFGDYHYKYESGRENDWFLVGFSPRKQNVALYGLSITRQPALMQKLGKYKTGKSCLYIKRLSDIDQKILQELVEQSIATTASKNAA
jgi:hypothetical protein